MKIILTEEKEKNLVRYLIKESYNYPDKVLLVKKFLDQHFSRATYDSTDDSGKPTEKQVVAWMNSGKEAVKTYTDVQLFEMLQEEFKNILADKNERDEFLKNVIKAWYNKKIDSNGIIKQ